MVPYQLVDTSLQDLLAAGINKGDVIIDGGNIIKPILQSLTPLILTKTMFTARYWLLCENAT